MNITSTVIVSALLAGCLISQAPAACAADDAAIDREAFSQPLVELASADRETFFRGRTLFRQSWVVAPAEKSSLAGLGPLFNRLACASCHQKNGRGHAPEGPGERMQSMLVRLSVPGVGPHGGPNPHPVYGDQLNEEGITGVPGEGRAEVRWKPHRVRLADGTPITLRSPEIRLVEPGYGPFGPILTSTRVSPAVFGLGLLEALSDATLEALAKEAKPDGVKGRVNHVWDIAAQRTVAGRFGLKANAPNVRQQSAGAFLGDMGITSPLFPAENCTPTQRECNGKPSAGQPELSAQQVDEIEFYLAHLAPPPRRGEDTPAVRRGQALFARAGCVACHRPALTTNTHPRFAALSGKAIAPYTDLLLHDMGPALADHRPDFEASGREWRTPPLWGIGRVTEINEKLSLLHDGRARNFEEAILWHGGEARPARERYARLPKVDRAALTAFLQSL